MNYSLLYDLVEKTYGHKWFEDNLKEEENPYIKLFNEQKEELISTLSEQDRVKLDKLIVSAFNAYETAHIFSEIKTLYLGAKIGFELHDAFTEFETLSEK